MMLPVYRQERLTHVAQMSGWGESKSLRKHPWTGPLANISMASRDWRSR